MAEVADHFYTTDPNGELAQSSGYVREGIAFFAFPTQIAGTVPLFRLFGGGDHFYTTDAGEVDFAVSVGYEREGVTAFVFPSQQEGTVPLLRLFGGGDHFYTTSAGEADFAASVGYEREGIAAFVFSSEIPGSVPIFRWWKNLNAIQRPNPLPPETLNLLTKLYILGHKVA